MDPSCCWGFCLAVEEDANTDTAAVKHHLADAAVEAHVGKRCLHRAPITGLPVLQSIDDLSIPDEGSGLQCW